MSKKIIFLWLSLGIMGWIGFQFAVTPWGELPGTLMFTSTRLPVEGRKGYANLMIWHAGSYRKFIDAGGYDTKWAPDGRVVVAFAGPGLQIVDESGKLVDEFVMPESNLGLDLEWFPAGDKILSIETQKGTAITGKNETSHIFLYDLKKRKRSEFYTQDSMNIRDSTISPSGKVYLAAKPAGIEHEKARFSIYEINTETKEISMVKKGVWNSYYGIEFINNGRQLVVNFSVKLFGKFLISTEATGVLDLKTGFLRYVDFWAGDVRQMAVVKDGKYLITAEGEGDAVVLYKRSLLGGFKLPLIKPAPVAHLNGFPSQDQYPAWTE